MFGNKVSFVLCIFALFTCHAGAWAQAQSTMMPETIGEPYYIDPTRHTIVPLQKEIADVKFSARALGFAGSTTRAELKGNRSNIRLAAAHVHEFVIRSVDPSRFKLYRLKSKKTKREVQMASVGALGLSGKTTLAKSEIPLSITECGPGCYQLRPEAELIAGEYAISPAGSNESYTFGVDPGIRNNN
jgi:hypothetical protein